MKPGKPTATNRRKDILHELFDSSARDVRMPQAELEATREAVVNYLSKLDRKSVVEALRRLYRQAACEAVERLKRAKR